MPDSGAVFACLAAVDGEVLVIWSRWPFTVRNGWVICHGDKWAFSEIVTRAQFEHQFDWCPRWHGIGRKRDWEKAARELAERQAAELVRYAFPKREQLVPSHPMLIGS